MNSEARLLSLSATINSDRTLESVFVSLSLKVKVLGFRKEGKFKGKENGKVNKVVLIIVVEKNI